MNNKGKLWQTFGPVICAFILLALFFMLPWYRTESKSLLFKASVSQSQNVFKGQRLKQSAFEGEYVPFYGSSELSRMDPMHPSVLAYKYKRNYRPFLLGGPGSQSLTHFFSMQETVNQLENKKAVFIISPQWFTKQGQDPIAFSMYFSQLQAVNWLLNVKNSNTASTKYAAIRLLEMLSSDSNGSTKQALVTLASGNKLSEEQIIWLKARRRVLINEDNFFSTISLANNVPRLEHAADKLPSRFNYTELHKIADKEGNESTNSNEFGISNEFFKKRFKKGELKNLKDSQKNFNYTQSPEYGDLELALTQLAHEHVNVLFVIPPVNEKWSAYTGLSHEMYQNTVTKIKYQLTSQGFDNIADLSRDGNKEHFMEDTIHLGWNGWLAVDKHVRPFMKQPNMSTDYSLNNYYFSDAWCNKKKVNPSKVLSKNVQEEKKIKATLNKENVQGTVTVIKNNKRTIQYSTGLSDIDNNKANTTNTSYLIDSVQKTMTGTMVLREVEKGNIKLSDKLSKYYPNVPHAEEITVDQLLKMKSGLKTKAKSVLGSPIYKDNQSGIEYDIKNSIIFSKDSYNRRSYSSINYVLLSGILEKVTHKTYEELFNETFIKKLKLKHTAFIWDGDKQLDQIDFAKSYQYRDSSSKELIRVPLDFNELHGELGAGSIAMSNGDMFTAIKAMIDGTLLRKETFEQQFIKNTGSVNYSNGFYYYSTFYGSNGGGYGYCSFIRISHDTKNAIIVQTNYPINNFYSLRNKMNNLMLEILQ